MKILDKHDKLTWDYDEEADVLDIAVGEPRAAVGVDVGDGLILRYDVKKREIVELTISGVRGRLLAGIAGAVTNARWRSADDIHRPHYIVALVTQRIESRVRLDARAFTMK